MGIDIAPKDIIPYDSYHPHLGYTLAVVCLAWLCVRLYSHYRLQDSPRRQVWLCALVIGLPLYAEGCSFLIYSLRPAPNTWLGYMLTHFHAFVLQRVPIDTFLSPLFEEVALGVLVVITLLSLARFGLGTYQLSKALRQATPLEQSSYSQLAAQFAQATAHLGVGTPQIRVLSHEAPLAFTTGLFTPKIYLSAALFDVLAPEELIAVLCHELAHVLRRDNLWNWAIRLLRDLLFFLPSNHILWKSMVESQDQACDALAAEITRQPLTLARALVKVASAWREHASNVPVPLTSQFELAHSNPDTRVARMIRFSDSKAQPQNQAVGLYILVAVFLVLAVFPALLGS